MRIWTGFRASVAGWALAAIGCGGVSTAHKMPENVTYEKAAASQESNPLDASSKAQLKRAPAAVKAQWQKEAEAAAKEKGN